MQYTKCEYFSFYISENKWLAEVGYYVSVYGRVLFFVGHGSTKNEALIKAKKYALYWNRRNDQLLTQ